MVFRELLGQFVAGELVIGGNPPHHAGDLQVEEVTVGGTAGQIGQPIGNISDADGMTGFDQEADDGAAARRVSLIGTTKPVFDDIVQVILRCRCCHRILPSSNRE